MSHSVTVGEIARQIRGVTYSGHEASSEPRDGYLPLLRANNITDEGISTRDIVYVPRERVSAAQLMRRGDILVATSSGSLSVVGKAARFDSDKPLSFGAFCKVVRPSDRVEPGYLAHFFQTESYRRRISSLAAGANINNLRNEHLDGLELALPPLPEQKRIVAILDKADTIRAKLREALAQADALLRSAFDHTVGYRATDYGSWEPRTMESLACDRPNSLRTGPFGSDLRHSEFTDGGVVVLGIDNAVQNRFAWAERRYISPEKYAKLERYRVFPGDVIVTIMGTTGRSAVVPDDIPLAISTKHLAAITLNPAEADPHFVSFAIHSDSRLRRQIEGANKGAIMDGLNLTIIRNLKIHLPPLSLQQHFAHLVRWHQTRQKQAQDPAENGDALYASLAQRAFCGEL